MTFAPQQVFMFALIPLILWRVYAKIRKMVGRQTSRPWRQWLTVCVFPVLVGLIGYVSAKQEYVLLGMSGGVVLGILLGIVGHKLTRFEKTAEGLFYTPNAHLGIALSLLLIGRLLYRFVVTGMPTATATTPVLPSPLTLAVFALLAGYYVTYAVGLIVWRLGITQDKPEPHDATV